MNIKKLLIITVFIVGLAPKNTLSGSGYCMPCSRNQYEAEEEDADLRSVSTEPIERAEQEEQQEAEQLIEFLEQQHPTMQYESSAAHERYPYSSQPAPVSYHDQDPYAPCDTQFEERESQDEAEEPIIIYRVR